ncbi:hypothetical protein GCM10023310_69490 [Paenibacillus vulneris]|uniref:Uncharacterized protein n=1 Tax=Paenibacillus vulneris TaxID=1133364 RepID=A0ABW3UH89_9BACL
MKIIRVDNYAREHVADKLVANNVTEFYGEKIVEFLNSLEHEHAEDFYKSVADDYVLWRGMEELV